ncbi:polar amino acid transport system substrate-binding protein [Nocardioides ginsengisegetis]|uniref:Polar amino acid transport system substrate-binding protein n=1 Tax=Nocardioides ginsengisegetis TaxID=661491 RepID=A0A7W3J054_9ACTN|nr:ABC transporter substrate-binding protein [Nocardioides ginsengisegetis]MBA8803852.1 polar amino acid transport system substrate-binding protein [Nocardioides ginsengisegetis]
MQNRPSRALVAATLSALALGMTACSSGGSSTSSSGNDLGLISDGTLTVCSDVPYPPFEDFDKSSDTGFKGFDVDVVNSIAAKLDVKVEIKDSSFDALKSGLAINSNQCDLVASAMTITPEREQAMGFSDGYYDSEQSLLVGADSGIASISDLSGVKVGVQKGTTGEAYANDHASGADIVVFPSDGEMYAALKAGQVDALLQDLPVNIDHQNDPSQSGAFKVVETYDTGEKYGFAMKKTNTGLIDAVDKALGDMKSDGSYQKIYDSYFATAK